MSVYLSTAMELLIHLRMQRYILCKSIFAYLRKQITRSLAFDFGNEGTTLNRRYEMLTHRKSPHSQARMRAMSENERK